MLIRLLSYRSSLYTSIRKMNQWSQLTRQFLNTRGTNELSKLDRRTNKEYQIIFLEEQYFESAWDVLDRIFFREETTCQFLELYNNSEAKLELKQFFYWVINDGISFAVKEKNNETILSVNLNKMWVPEDDAYLKYYHDRCSQAQSRKFLQEIIDLNACAICTAKTVLEIFAGASYPELRGQGITGRMFYLSVDLASYIRGHAGKEGNTTFKDCPGAVMAITSSPVARFICERTKLNANRIERKRVLTFDEKQMEADFLIAFERLK